MSFSKYPAYKTNSLDWLGSIPEHWEITRLKRLIDPERPITYGIVQAGPHVPDGIPYIRPADMSDEGGVSGPDCVLRTSIEIADAYRRSTIREGDLVCSIGPSFGKVMITPEWLDGANLTQGTARLAVAHSHSSRFIFWVLRAPETVAQWESAVGGATFRALNLAPLAETVLACPPQIEQLAIADFLDRETALIDALVTEQQRLIGLLKEKRQAVIFHAVTRGLHPNAPMKDSGLEWMGKVPAHWEVRRLKHISASITVGIVVNPSVYVADEGLPFIYGGDIREGVIDWQNSRRIDANDSKANSKTTLHAGDLLTVRVGAPGVTAVVPRECEGGNCASVMLIRQGQFDSNWLCFAMNTRTVRFQVEVVQYGAAQEQFNLSHAANFWVPTPPESEQVEISDFLKSEIAGLDTLIIEAQRAINLLHERRAALISAAVTGQMDVRTTTPRPVA